jgi:hypothetical protein
MITTESRKLWDDARLRIGSTSEAHLHARGPKTRCQQYLAQSSLPQMPRLWLIGALACFAATVNQNAQADTYLSNLKNVYPDPETNSIGDIHGLFPRGQPYGSNLVPFTTGPGFFLLNSITLEFEFARSWPEGSAAPGWVDIELFEHVGTNSFLVGSLASPSVNPTPTQWPDASKLAWTTFYDFWPSREIQLLPLSRYSLVLSMPPESPVAAALLFSISSKYVARDGWTMTKTISDYPQSTGNYLKIAVDATSIPEPSTVAMFVVGCLLVGWRILSSPAPAKG